MRRFLVFADCDVIQDIDINLDTMEFTQSKSRSMSSIDSQEWDTLAVCVSDLFSVSQLLLKSSLGKVSEHTIGGISSSVPGCTTILIVGGI